MDSSVILLVGAVVAYVAVAWNAWNSHRTTVERERQLTLRLYDSVVAPYEESTAEKLLRIRALRLLIDSLANEELRPGLLCALEAQELALSAEEGIPEPDAESVALHARALARRELGIRFDAPARRRRSYA